MACSTLIAARAGKRPSTALVYNWAFATAHAFLRELKPVDGVAWRWRRCGAAVTPWRWPRSRRSRACASRCTLRGSRGQFGDHIYVTTMVARPKPAPDIYLLAAERLGVAPADCIVMEDSPAGAAAALDAGMQAIGYAPGKTFDAMRASGATSSARWTS